MKVIGYARVSTTNQDLVRQRTNIENFCKEQGYNLLYIIEDFGISGATNEREGYKRVMALTTSDCDLLVVSELSRLSRKEDITETLNDISKVVAHNGISMLLLDQKSKTYEGGVTLPIADLLMLIISLYGAAQERIETKRKY
jgi:site-specific DNA recombinase